MPKGHFGCWVCGKRPTTRRLQVTLYDFEEDRRYSNGCRASHTVDSVMRSLCSGCVDDLMDRCSPGLGGQRPWTMGCRLCGDQTTSRVQVWLRDQDQRTLKSLSGGFCEECSLIAYSAAIAPINPGDDWAPTGQKGQKGPAGFAAARARLAA